MAGRTSTPRRGETSPDRRRPDRNSGDRNRADRHGARQGSDREGQPKQAVEKKRNEAIPILVGGGAILLVIILIVVSRSGSKPAPVEEPVVQRVVPQGPIDPFAATSGQLLEAALPVGQRFLEAISAKDADTIKALIDFPRFHENEARRLEAEGQTYAGWASLGVERQQEYKLSLVKRLQPTKDSLKSFRLDLMVLDDQRPEASFLDQEAPDFNDRYRRLEVLYKMRSADWSGTGKKPVYPFYVGLCREGEVWSVEDLSLQTKTDRIFAPNPASKAYQKYLAGGVGGGQKIDLEGDIASQLEGGPRRVRLEDGTVGLADKPKPVPYFETTTPEMRTKIEQLMAQMLDPAQTTGWMAARDELLTLKRDAVPAALTQLARVYKQAVEETKGNDPLDDQEIDKLQKITQLLMKMREEVYQEEYDGKVGFTRMEYASNELDRMRRDINKVSMFWFGWWVKNQDVIPQGEPMTLRRPRNR